MLSDLLVDRFDNQQLDCDVFSLLKVPVRPGPLLEDRATGMRHRRLGVRTGLGEVVGAHKSEY